MSVARTRPSMKPLARERATKSTPTPTPTPKTASISPDVNDPGARNTSFEELRAAYYEQVQALVSDLLLGERTIVAVGDVDEKTFEPFL